MKGEKEEKQKELHTINQKFNIEFANLCYSVKKGKGKTTTTKQILKNINGKFESGHLTAILGPSGAGKTSLFNVLSGFKTSGMTGCVRINGQLRNMAEFRKLSSHITQEFAMLSLLTTQETLMNSADLKLGSIIGRSRKTAMIDEILNLLGLQKTKDTLVGNLSGGEKKRLSIGVELVTNPPIMFFDEPTSGLDSSSSVQVISHLKSLAESGRTVVCAIHQPSSRLFEMFDDLYILAEGQCLYSGPVCDMTTVFEEEGFLCPRYYNRADFAIEVACNERGSTDKLITRYNKQIHTSDVCDLDEEGDREEALMLHPVTSTESDTTSLQIPIERNCDELSKYSVSSMFQFIILVRRSMLCIFRDMYLAPVRFFIHLVVGLLLGALCYNIGNDASKLTGNTAYIFFLYLFIFMVSPVLTVLIFPMEVDVFLREHLNNWYTLRAYYFSKLVSDLPLQILCPTAFVLASYFLVDQPFDGMRLPKFWAAGVLVAICGQNLGFAVGAAFNSNMAIFLLIAMNALMVLFSGFLIRLCDIPIYLQWFTDVTYFRYALQAGLLSVYGDNRPNLNCDMPYCHFRAPSKILDEFDMSESLYETAIIAIFIWIIVLQVVFYFILKWRLYISR